MNDDAIEAMNRAYRARDAPSDLAQTALQTVLLQGDLPPEMRDALVDELWDCVPESKRGPYDTTIENGLASAFTREEDSVHVYISENLFSQQPLGVILGDLHDHVQKRGSAIITDVVPRSATVNDIMDHHHIAITITPLAVWLNRYVGTENGFEPLDRDATAPDE